MQTESTILQLYWLTKTSIDGDSGEQAKQSKKKTCRTHRMSIDGSSVLPEGVCLHAGTLELGSHKLITAGLRRPSADVAFRIPGSHFQ
jgi:hypothetical protein